MKAGTTVAAMAALILCAAGLAGCEEPAADAPPPAVGSPIPPSPDLPMTAAKAREIVAGLSLSCTELASLKAAMLQCEERQGRMADHAALRTELRDLKWTLQTLPVEEASARCSALTNELRATPKPQVCWDLGNG